MNAADRVGIVLAASVISLDQTTKWLVHQGMDLHQSTQVIPGLLNLTHVRNTGAAFGLLATPSPGLRTATLAAFSAIAIGVILWVWVRNRPAPGLFISSLALILGGAVGNLIDRIRLGEVIDFVDVHWRSYHWPAFNVADSAITIGVGLLIVHLLFHKASSSPEGSRGAGTH